ncbi:hypothetical protein BJ508DRAFT_327974 [Ascobolus immersus RN42]|uniref:Uncharacterized protein n=1 Tax=Ascobolus immersus RN42 TaxID=1160509 RepID=A0A3N4I6I6_ASCIM|nr:hypothetical protein BJ508DRAFT_327974 [Ascobolus immersus RN42]
MEDQVNKSMNSPHHLEDWDREDDYDSDATLRDSRIFDRKDIFITLYDSVRTMRERFSDHAVRMIREDIKYRFQSSLSPSLNPRHYLLFGDGSLLVRCREGIFLFFTIDLFGCKLVTEDEVWNWMDFSEHFSSTYDLDTKAPWRAGGKPYDQDGVDELDVLEAIA